MRRIPLASLALLLLPACGPEVPEVAVVPMPDTPDDSVGASPEPAPAPEPEPESEPEAKPEPAPAPPPVLPSRAPQALCIDCLHPDTGGDCYPFQCDGLTPGGCAESDPCRHFIQRTTCSSAAFECEVYGQSYGTEFTCTQLCGSSGTLCVGGWNDRDDACGKDERDIVGCDDYNGSAICRCAVP